MHVKRNKFSRLRHELRRRKTDRVIVAYAAAAFAILQLFSILKEEFILPSWAMTVLIISRSETAVLWLNCLTGSIKV